MHADSEVKLIQMNWEIRTSYPQVSLCDFSIYWVARAMRSWEKSGVWSHDENLKIERLVRSKSKKFSLFPSMLFFPWKGLFTRVFNGINLSERRAHLSSYGRRAVALFSPNFKTLFHQRVGLRKLFFKGVLKGIISTFPVRFHQTFWILLDARDIGN